MELRGTTQPVKSAAVYAFSKDAIPVDTHVHRISNRLGWVKTKHPEQTEKALSRIVPQEKWQVINDLLVHHGKTICRPISPQCSQCPIKQRCLWAKTKKTKKTLKYGMR